MPLATGKCYRVPEMKVCHLGLPFFSNSSPEGLSNSDPTPKKPMIQKNLFESCCFE